MLTLKNEPTYKNEPTSRFLDRETENPDEIPRIIEDGSVFKNLEGKIHKIIFKSQP